MDLAPGQAEGPGNRRTHTYTPAGASLEAACTRACTPRERARRRGSEEEHDARKGGSGSARDSDGSWTDRIRRSIGLAQCPDTRSPGTARDSGDP